MLLNTVGETSDRHDLSNPRNCAKNISGLTIDYP